MPHSAHQNVTPGQQSSSNASDDRPNPEFIESTPEEISRRVPALAPEIVSQIRDSVANLNDGRPVVIEVNYRFLRSIFKPTFSVKIKIRILRLDE